MLNILFVLACRGIWKNPLVRFNLISLSDFVAALTSLLMLGNLKHGAFVSLVIFLKSIIIRGLLGSALGTANRAIVFKGLLFVSSRIPASTHSFNERHILLGSVTIRLNTFR